MKYVIDIPAHLIEKINNLIQRESLDDIHQFIFIAIKNQLILDNIDVGPLQEQLDLSNNVKTNSIENEYHNPIKRFRIKPDLYRDIQPVSTVNFINRPIPGWYNRLFPLKMSLRIILNEYGNSESLSFDSLKTIVSKQMVKLKPYMLDIDDVFELSRGRRISIGFPDDNEKSIKRFKSHYFGIIRSNGDVVGALPNLGFTSIISDDDPTIGITEQGIQFSSIPNPIIDDDQVTSDVFSSKEIDFLINHIKTNIPEEFSLMSKLIQWISEGLNSPTTITHNIQKMNPDWSYKVANNIRIGLIGRMKELGIIKQNRDGIHISYLLASDYEDIIKINKQ